MKSPSEQTKSKSSGGYLQHKPVNWKLAGKIVAVNAAVLVVLFLAADIPARMKFSTVNAELDKVQTEVMAQEQAVVQGEKFRHSGGDGALAMMRCFPDTGCPYARAGWVVAVTPGEEKQFLRESLERLGYRIGSGGVSDLPCIMKEPGNSCEVGGSKDGLTMYATVYFADSDHHKLPSTDPSPKVFRFVDVRVQ